MNINIAKKAWLSFTLAFFLFYERLRSFTDLGNRQEMAWSFMDVIVVYACVIAVGAVIFTVWCLLKKLKVSEAVIDRAYIVTVFFSVGYAFAIFIVQEVVMRWVGPFRNPFDFLQFNKINYYGYFSTGLLRLLNLILFVFAFTIASRLFKKILTQVLFLISPIIIVYPIVALTFKAVPMTTGGLESPSINTSLIEKRIFFFLFDEWDYQNTYHNRLGPLNLPGVRKLAEKSNVYQNAITASSLTGTSIPIIIGEHGKGKSNIFTHAKEANWQSYIVAAYLPYQLMYGTTVDYCLRVVWYKFLPLFSGRLLYESTNSLYSVLSFWVPTWTEPRIAKKGAMDHRHQTDALHQHAMNLIVNGRGLGLYYFHYPIPHWPFFIEPELLSRGIPHHEAQVQGYRHNLEEMDKCIVDIIYTLERTHQWNNSLLIFTGDHGWREDPMRPRALIENRHVPLFIKFPGQKKAQNIKERFDIKNLKDIIEKEMGKPKSQALNEKNI